MSKTGANGSSEFLINNSLYIFLIAAIIAHCRSITRYFVSMNIHHQHRFALGGESAHCARASRARIILTGTDLSAGRVVGPDGLRGGFAAADWRSTRIRCSRASALCPCPSCILVVIAIGALVGADQRLLYGQVPSAPVYRHAGHPAHRVRHAADVPDAAATTTGSLSPAWIKVMTNLITGSILSVPDGKGNMVPIPNFVWYAIVITVVDVVRLEQDRLSARTCSPSAPIPRLRTSPA